MHLVCLGDFLRLLHCLHFKYQRAFFFRTFRVLMSLPHRMNCFSSEETGSQCMHVHVHIHILMNVYTHVLVCVYTYVCMTMRIYLCLWYIAIYVFPNN